MGAHLKSKMRRKYVELTFFPSLNLTCPSATTVSVIFCHGFEQLRVRVCACVQGLTFQNSLWSPGPRRQTAPCLLRHQTTEAVRDTASSVVALCQVSPVVPLHQVLFTVEFIQLKAQSAHLSLNSPSVRYQTGISVALTLICRA